MGRDGGRGGGGGGVGLTEDGVAGRTREEDPERNIYLGDDDTDKWVGDKTPKQEKESGKLELEIFRFTANSPLLVPSAPGVGEDTVARYVGGGGGGCALRLLSFESLDEVTFPPPPSLGWLGSVTLDCPS